MQEGTDGSGTRIRAALKDAATRGFNMGMSYMAEKHHDSWPAEVIEKIPGWTLGDFPELAKTMEEEDEFHAEATRRGYVIGGQGLKSQKERNNGRD